MKCEHCHKDNRDIAKFCRWCGSPLSAHNLLDKIIGLDEVKQQMRLIVETYNYLHSRKDIANVRLSINTIIVGETGTGKELFAQSSIMQTDSLLKLSVRTEMLRNTRQWQASA